MLTQEQLSIVKATVPVLQQHGEEITRVFYKTMFAAHPELLDVFNENNQRSGDQPKSLAGAVCAYAANIDNLGALGEAVGRIGHKHASLEIKAEHYPIVGDNLLKAIKIVLGDAATDDIIGAWAAAYGQLADIFIGYEGNLYKTAAEQTGGWSDFKPFVVKSKVKESDLITSFYLEPKGGAPLPSFTPGQYTCVKFKLPDWEHVQMRQYSLSDSPGKNHYRISVKRELGEIAGLISNHLHDNVQVGDEVLVHTPMGVFTLDVESQRPAVFISGGVGLTPLLSMAEHLVGTGSKREILFIHACKNKPVHAFRERIFLLSDENLNFRKAVFYEDTSGAVEGDDYDHEGYVSIDKLAELIPREDADYYFCGPLRFMGMIDTYLGELGVPAERRHYEVFGPTVALEIQPVAN